MTGPVGMADFVGRWHLTRQIDDRAAGQVVTGEGRADFRPDGATGLIYDEAVVLHIPKVKPLQGTRRYLWRADGDAIAVLFDDGRPFHRIALGQATPGDLHDCPPDMYEGAYDFTRWPDWRARWCVRGPRKDYVMVTEFRRDT